MRWLHNLPRSARLGLGVAFLLLAPFGIIAVTQSSSEPESRAIEKQRAELAPAEERRARGIERLIRTGDIRAASAEITNSITGRFPPGAYSRFLDTLQKELEKAPTRESLDLYGQVLGKVVRTGEQSDDFQFHMRRMRHMALMRGGKELLRQVGDPTFGYDGLADYYRRTDADLMSQLELVSYFLLYDRHEQALTVLLGTLEQDRMSGRMAAATDGEWLAAARLLARIAGAGGDPAARRAMDDLARTLEAHRGHTLHADEVRDWMDGVARMYSPQRSHARGARQIEKAVKRNTLALDQQIYRVDLARALRDEAHRREAVLRDEYLPSERDRGRQYFTIGWGAAQLGHPEELRLAIRRLAEDPGNRQGRTYLRILRGLGDLAAGLPEQGRQRIQDTLDQYPELLQPDEVARLREAIAAGELPVAREPGRLLFAMGKLWMDLEQRPSVDRVMARLSREISGPEDLAYLSYLEALTMFGDGKMDGVRERLYDLLDARLPPDLSREEVAALLFLTEERMEDLARIRQRRRRALEILETLHPVENVSEGTLARLVEWQIRMDETRGRHILTGSGNDALAQLEKSLEGPWLEYPLEEVWLALEDELLQQTLWLRQAGKLEAAYETLERCRALVKNPTRFRAEEAHILAAKAAATSVDQRAAARDLWHGAGAAFMAAASSSFGDPELYFDATEAYIAAGDFHRARRASGQYAPAAHRGATAESRYWRSVVSRIRIDRELGDPKGALERAQANIERHESGVHRYELLMERGLCQEMLGDEDAALRDYDSVYRELEPSSESWQDALHRRAVILQRRVEERAGVQAGGAVGGGLLERETRVAAHNAWLELAAWLPEESGDVRLGQALYRSGEAWIADRNYSRARDQLRRLLDIAARLRERTQTRTDRDRWQRYEERALFSYADTYYLERDYRAASGEYRKAVARYRESAWVPYGYYQLGQCELKDGHRDEAVRDFQLGLRKTQELPDTAFDDSPKGRDFWVETFQEQIRAHDR